MKKLLKEKKLEKIKKQIKKGKKLIIRIPENWSCLLEKYSSTINEPIKDFKLLSCIKKGKKEIFLCESLKAINGKNVKIALTNNCLRYLWGKNVSQEYKRLNEGYSFEKYLPPEGTKVLITKTKNPSDIVPAHFGVELEQIELNKKIVFLFNFRVDFLTGNGFAVSEDYQKGARKATWKFIYGAKDFMTPFEMLYSDTIIHKELVVESCEILALELEKKGAENHARRLRERARVHDNSKIGYSAYLPEYEISSKKKKFDDELYALSKVSYLIDTMKNVDGKSNSLVKEATELHWRNNSHHPEHYKSCLDMTNLDVMEMVADWVARATQMETDILEYVNNSQKERFHFPDWMFQQIMNYLNLILDNSKVVEKLGTNGVVIKHIIPFN